MPDPTPDVTAQPSPVPQTQSPDLSGIQLPPVATPQPQQVATPDRQPPPQHLSAWHRAAQALMGNSTSYVPDPANPNGPPKEVTTPNKPGQLFRSILAGAIMGGAAGAESHAGNGWGAAAVGGKAAMQNQQQQDEIKRQTARQNWQDQLKAQEADRAQKEFDTKQTYQKALTAQANAETLRTNLLTQGSSFGLHQDVVKADKDRISMFEQAGVKPLFNNVPESQMTDYIKNHPGAGSLDWRHTGVTTIMTKDKDGNDIPNYEYTLSAYDPKASAPLSKDTIKQWDEDGLFKYHPEYKDQLKPGKVLDVDQFTSLSKESQSLFNNNLQRNGQQLDLEHKKIEIEEAKSAIKKNNAEAGRAGLESAKIAKDSAKEKRVEDAWNHLAKANNDVSKISAEDRITLSREAQPAMSTVMSAIKASMTDEQNGDPDAKDRLSGLWKQYQGLSQLANIGTSGPETKTPAANDVVGTALSALGTLNANDVYDAIQSSTALTPAQKTEVYDKWKQKRDEEGKNTRETVKGVLKNIPSALTSGTIQIQ